MSKSRETPSRGTLLDSLGLAGRQLSTATIMFHQAVADRLGLNITDHKCLDFVLMNGSMTAGELAAMTGMTTGAITAVLDRLERAGFVRREDDPNDRRRVIVRVVAKRVGEASQLFEPFSALLGEMTSRYDAAELAVIVDFMTRSCEVLRQSTLELRQETPSVRRRRGKTRRRTRPRKASARD